MSKVHNERAFKIINDYLEIASGFAKIEDMEKCYETVSALSDFIASVKTSNRAFRALAEIKPPSEGDEVLAKLRIANDQLAQEES